MNRFDDISAEERDVRDIWDALVSGNPTPGETGDREVTATIKQLHSLDTAPALAPDSQDSIWRSVQAEVAEAELLTPLFLSNGHHPKTAESAQSPTCIERENQRSNRKQIGARVFRLLAIGVMSGAVAGAIAGGLGSRVAMRIAGSLSDGVARSMETQDGNTVGSLSIGGTISLVIFAALVGVAGGILYMPFRSLIPTTSRYKGVLYGASILFTLGFVIMDKGNSDYRTFGSPAINVGAFSACYVLFGVVVAPVVEWLNRTLPDWPLEHAVRWRNAPQQALILFFGVVGCFAVLIAVLAGGTFILASLVLSFLCGFLARMYEKVIRGRPLNWKDRSALVRNAMIGGPAVAGLAITVRSVVSILGLG